MDSLWVSTVPRALELKSKLFGFELPDLLLIFTVLSLTNFVFGATPFRYVLVWGTTRSLALFLFFFKRGKPDNYVTHSGQFLMMPTIKIAGGSDKHYRNIFRRKA